jgi:protein-disulfide isomerase
MTSRRTLLASLAALSAGTLAGCSGGGDEGSSGDDAATATDSGGSSAATTAESGPTTTDSGTSLASHPGAKGLESQPVLGPDPADAAGVVVAFEDPSCPTCRRWERETFPKLKSKLVDPGTVSLVFRGFPVVYPWGKPATHALEATYERDSATFWDLKDHYYAEQGSFDAENVLSKTESFLADTDVDGEAVVADVESGATDEAVNLDLSAGKAVGFRGTPSFLLFKDGQFQTKVVGAQSYSVFANALGV